MPKAVDYDRRHAERIAGVPVETKVAVVLRRAGDEPPAPRRRSAEQAEIDVQWAPPPAKRWLTTRVARRELGDGGPDARKRAEKEFHDLWSSKALELLKLVDAPVLRAPDGAQRDDKVLRHLFAKRRASTLRARTRVFGFFLGWLRLRRAGRMEYDSTDLLGYLTDLFEEKRGASVPRSVVYAVMFFERFGGKPDQARIYHDPLVLATAESMEADLPRAGGTRTEAIRYPFLVVVAMELTLVDPATRLYDKLLCGYNLTKAWACLRFDDTKGLCPHKVRDAGQHFVLPLDRTKTSSKMGGRPQEAFLAKRASLSGAMWVEEFMGFLKSGPLAFTRDYMLPLPASGFQDVLQSMASYSDASALSRTLLESLRTPVMVKVGTSLRWQLGPMPLMDPGMADAFTEHSPRKFLVSLASPLAGVNEDHLDKLGDWSTQGARRYDQSVGRVVANLQRLVSDAVPEIAAKYGEVDLKDRLVEFAVSRMGRSEEEAVKAVLPMLIESVSGFMVKHLSLVGG